MLAQRTTPDSSHPPAAGGGAVLTIIGSSGGSALRGALECLRLAGREPRLLVITDRECGLSAWANARHVPSDVLPHRDPLAFSMLAHDRMLAAGSSDALLFYTRLVAGPLVHAVRTCNIHPSLLPAFPGLHALRDARAAGAARLGATLHHVDTGLDTGRIVGQVWCPMPAPTATRLADRLSYLQKIWLTLAWIDHRERQVALPEAASIPPVPHAPDAAAQAAVPGAVISTGAISAGTIAPLDPRLCEAFGVFAHTALQA